MKKLVVFLEGLECGQITQTSQGNLSFAYDKKYLGTNTPLSLSMPVGFAQYPKRKIHPFLKGLLPDNPNALQALAKKYGANVNNPFDLLQFVGAEVAGAIELVGEYSSVSTETVDSVALDDLAVEALLKEKINEYEDATVATTATSNLSLAGAQAKLVLQKTETGIWKEPTLSQISTHIIKPVPLRWRNLDVVEHQTMLAAKHLGLNVATSEIATFGATRVFISKRYDRKKNEQGALVRVHQEDLCQALSVDPKNKYQRDDGGPGVADIANLFREFSWAQDQKAVAVAFFEALAFNVLARCTDAHAKNYSLILSGERVAMAPLYDLSSTVLYGSDFNGSAMSINSKYKFSQITDGDLLYEAKKLRLDADWAQALVKAMRANIMDAFSVAGESIRKAIENDDVAKTTYELVDALHQHQPRITQD